MPHHIDARILWQPKSGHRPEEYEDAAFVSDTDGRSVRASVADGATEAAYARRWAQLLVRGFADEGTTQPDVFGQRLEGWRRQWQDDIAQESSDHSWYAEAKRAEGAYAAFLGISIDADGSWEALCVGDCALFHLRDEVLEKAWPFDEGAAFVTRPALLPSLPGRAIPQMRHTGSMTRPGDAFVLATDALAVWLYEHDPAVVCSWEPADFQAEVDVARTNGTLRNDDVTALVLEVR